MGSVKKNSVDENLVKPIDNKNLVRPISNQNLVKPIKRYTARQAQPARPETPNTATIVLAVIFWPITLAVLIIGKSVGGTIRR